MNLITLDFETYYDKDMSLSKMQIIEYINDPRFQVICVGYKLNNDDTEVITGTHDEIGARLKSLPWGDAALLCHNTIFDASILNTIFNIRPVAYMDTMCIGNYITRPFAGSASLAKMVAHHIPDYEKGTEVVNAFGKRREDFTTDELAAYMDYCRNDVDITRELFNVVAGCIPTSEHKLIDLTIRAYVEPSLEYDSARLMSRLNDVETEKLKALILVPNGDPGVLRSNDKFAELLRSYGVEPPTKISPTTGNTIYAFAKTDAGFTELLNHPNEIVRSLATARLTIKSNIEETRITRFISHANRGFKVAVPLRYYGAHTGRFSGMESMNFQNMPRGSALRYSMVAPEGYSVVAGDSSNIEARLTAWWAGEQELVEAFRNGKDVYKMFAEKYLFDYEVAKDSVERFIGKQCILSLGYAAGADRFYEMLRQTGKMPVTPEYAAELVETYRAAYPCIKRLWYIMNDAILAMQSGTQRKFGVCVTQKGSMLLPNGMHIFYPLLTTLGNETAYFYGGKQKRLYGAKLLENCVQALARIVVTNQLLTTVAAAKQVAPSAKFVLNVHDELVFRVADSERDVFVKLLEKTMSMPPEWAPDLPVACEVASGKSYGECK